MKITKHSRESLLSILQQLDNNIIAVAMDGNGAWYGYRDIPRPLGGRWSAPSPYWNVVIPRETIEVVWVGHWKDSLYMLEVVPEYEPYSKATLGELEEKSMRLRVRRKRGGSMTSWILNEVGNKGVILKDYSGHERYYCIHKNALAELEWADGSVFGVEKKGEG